MKRNAIVRIIIFSLIIVMLLGILLVGLGVGLYSFRTDTQYDAYILGGGEVLAREVREIEIEWSSGDITIQTADIDTITFQEIGSEDSDPMVYRRNGDKLIIEYQTPRIHFGFTSSGSKDLVLTVPHDWYCHNLSVDAASADLFINGLAGDELDLNMASGDCNITDCDLVDLDMDCASGEVHYVGTLNTMDCSTASGKVTAVFKNVPASIDFEGASADLELTLPENAGFTVDLESLSGSFLSEFETTRRDDQYICGDGACKIDVDGLSGSVTIRKMTHDIPNTR